MINQIGMVLLSRRVNNHEAELLELDPCCGRPCDGDQVCWATDPQTRERGVLAAHSPRLLACPALVAIMPQLPTKDPGRPMPKTLG